MNLWIYLEKDQNLQASDSFSFYLVRTFYQPAPHWANDHTVLFITVYLLAPGRTHPVLIQGETSVGKTSLIRWLAMATGNQFVRINNHEHTDIQEYIGCYSSDHKGKLVFKEGMIAVH